MNLFGLVLPIPRLPRFLGDVIGSILEFDRRQGKRVDELLFHELVAIG